MKRFSILLLVLVVAGCAWSAPQWHWQHPDNHYAQQHREQDIYECEEYASQLATNGPPDDYALGRNYGGWGNFTFELCMESRGWQLVYGP